MPKDTASAFWQNAAEYQAFELRAHRFRDEMLPLFLTWLGIAPDSNVLDGGCGTGVFTRYLAKGLPRGHITGFDINKTLIEFGRGKAAENMALDVCDGYELPYDDGAFDAVTGYTYTVTLSDPESGIRELMRVCRPGGTVSSVIGKNSLPYAFWQGGYPFDEKNELQALARRENDLFSRLHRGGEDGRADEVHLFKSLGLEDIHMYPFAHLICYGDSNFSADYRRALAIAEAEEEIVWLESRYEENQSAYEKEGFTKADYDRLMHLHCLKRDYLRDHFDDAQLMEWHGGYNYIVTGRLPT